MAGRRIEIEILPTAKLDLQDIVDFIAKGSKKYAQIEKLLILNAISKLIYNPFLGKSFNHKGIEGRQFIFRNYLVSIDLLLMSSLKY